MPNGTDSELLITAMRVAGQAISNGHKFDCNKVTFFHCQYELNNRGVIMNIAEEVHRLYWEDDKNCAITTVSVLSALYDIELSDDLYSSLLAMPGLGKNGLTCGIAVGAVMFIGLYGKDRAFEKDDIKLQANHLIKGFIDKFGSELCSVLRPEGFKYTNPPHICENLTVDAIKYVDEYVRTEMDNS